MNTDAVTQQKNWNGKPYHSLDHMLRERFGEKVYKVTLNGGMSCPNRDGKLGSRGCIFCSAGGSGDFAADAELSVTEQIDSQIALLSAKRPIHKYIAYFQANSNTYCSVNFLKEKVDEVLSYDNVCGINIATRCDCIKDDMLEYLKELNKKTDLVIELGLQTIKDETSKLINRAHTLKEFEDMYKILKDNNIKVVVHIINGLPYETKEDMLNTVKYLNNLKIDGIKIHMLHILKDTPLEKLYKKEKFHVLTRKEYVDIVCDQLEYLNEDIVINRITGDPHEEDLIEPFWLQKKFCVLNEIDKELVKRNTYQGKKC